jgi:predicted nucleic acid-binding protein
VGGAVYIDTCVIVSYVDEADPNHERAVRLVEGLGGERFVSMLSLVELASVYSRAGLGEPLPLAVYSVRAVGGRVAGLDFNKVLREAFERAPALKLRTLDLLHLVACRAAGCEEFATLDAGVAGRADAVSRELGVRVVTAV